MTQNPPPILPVRVRKAERRDKSPERRAIEAALKASTEPLSKQQLALQCAVDVEKTQHIIASLRIAGDVRRGADGFNAEARYQWSHTEAATTTPQPADIEPPAPPVAPGYMPLAGQYQGRELHAFTGRPGAMDAFSLPSIHNGQRIERRTPMIMGSTTEKRRPV